MSIRGGFMQRMQSREEGFNLSELTQRAYQFLWTHLKKYKRRMGLALLATLSATAIALSLPNLVRIAVDEYIAQENFRGLTFVSIGYLLLIGLQWLALYWQNYLSNWVGQKIIHDMRQDLFAKVLKQTIRFHESEQVGQITSRLTDDVNAVASFVSDGAVNLLADLITVLGIIVIMAIINWQLTLITLISLPLAILSIRVLGKKMREAYWDVQQALAEVNTGVEQSIAGMRVVKSLSQESFTIEKFEQLSLQNMKANLRTSLLFAAVFPTMTITNMLGTALVLGYGGTLIAQGQTTVGVLMAFLAYVYRMYGPLRELGLVYGSIQAAGASLDRILDVMEQQTELEEPKNPQKPPQGFQGNINVAHISFSYEEELVLRDISFEVDAGQSLAIVGPSGAGKSTLAKLIARLYDVQEGTILIDGINIKDIALQDLRQIVTIIPQDVFLFADSILENIRYGDPKATDEEIKAAAQHAQAHAFISELPDGYETQVGELGVKLSGGQKQLIAFARAILADPKILILDEATANVDPFTESLIQTAMADIAKDRTTLIIAHRFSTLSQVDKTLVIDNGEMVGFDTHEVLIQENEVYQQLYKRYQNRNQLKE